MNNDFYSILGVAPTATSEEIKSRYRFLCQAYHPDKFSSDAHRRIAEEEFRRINEAYQVLYDPSQRERFDTSRSRTSPPPVTPPTPKNYEHQSSSRQAPSHTSASNASAETPEFYFNRGSALLVNLLENSRDNSNLNKAIMDFDKAIQLDPKYAKAYCYRGMAHKAKQKFNKAFADFNEAIRLDPRYAKAYFSRGLTHKAKGDFKKAIADYDEAIRLNPKDELAYSNRAHAHSAKCDTDKAIADYDEVIRLNPKSLLAHCAYNNRGNAYYLKGLQRNRWWHLGRYAYQARVEYLKAFADFSELVRLNPRNQYANEMLKRIGKHL